MPWKVPSIMSERLEFVRMVEAGTVSLAELCRRFGISRKTGHKWLARYREAGSSALTDRSQRRRAELLERSWGTGIYPADRTVDNHIVSLRRKLEPDPQNPQHILTAHAVGYKLVL